jgi:Carboxypeptidase regulatory-like domain/Putative Ig domain
VDEIYADVACAASDMRRGTPVVVGATDVTGIDFTIAAGGVLAGVVTDTTGVGVADVPVSVFDAAGTLVEQATSSATGSFRVTVPPGPYRARAEATLGYGAEMYREVACTSGSCDVSSGTPIAISTGATASGIDFTLPSCPGMTLSPSLLATGVAGRAYRQVVGVTGGVSPFMFEVTTGALPPGLTLDRRSGVVAGVPSTSGRHAFEVASIDANGCGTARAYTVDVHACAFVLSSSSATVPSAGGTVAVTIADACGSQEVAQQPFWVHVASNTTGQVVLTVDPNAAPVPRTATLSIGRRVFEVRQSGQTSQPPSACWMRRLTASRWPGRSRSAGGRSTIWKWHASAFFGMRYHRRYRASCISGPPCSSRARGPMWSARFAPCRSAIVPAGDS